MDTGEGYFVQADPESESEYFSELRKKYPKSKGVFSVGEEIEIKGSRFVVKRINPFGILLKLLKQ